MMQGHTNFIGLNMFLFFNLQWNLELVYFKILDQFNYSSIKICEFNLFNQILLSLFDISSVFYNSIWLNIKVKMCQTI